MWPLWSGTEAQKGHKMQNDEVKIKTLKTKSEKDKIKTKPETENQNIENKNEKVIIAMWPFWATVWSRPVTVMC